MKNWTILNPLWRNNLWNNFLIFQISPAHLSSHSIGFSINGKMNLNILFMQQEKVKRVKLNAAAKSMQNSTSNSYVSSLDIYHTLCLSAVAAFFLTSTFIQFGHTNNIVLATVFHLGFAGACINFN